MTELAGIKTLIEMAPHLAGIVVMVILIKRMLPDKGERELEREVRQEQARIMRELTTEQARHGVKIDDHERRITTHDEAITGLAQQVQTTIAGGRH